MMRGLIWLAGLLLLTNRDRNFDYDSFNKRTIGARTKLKDNYWLPLLLTNIAQLGASFCNIFFRMRVVPVPGEFDVVKSDNDELVKSEGYVFVDQGFCKETIFKNFVPKPDRKYKYKLVAFPGYIGLIKVLITGFLHRWGIANWSELKKIDSSVDLRSIGLGENFVVMTLGTVIRKPTTKLAIYSPYALYSVNGATRANEKKLQLHDLFDNIGGNCYILFRTK